MTRRGKGRGKGKNRWMVLESYAYPRKKGRKKNAIVASFVCGFIILPSLKHPKRQMKGPSPTVKLSPFLQVGPFLLNFLPQIPKESINPPLTLLSAETKCLPKSYCSLNCLSTLATTFSTVTLFLNLLFRKFKIKWQKRWTPHLEQRTRRWQKWDRGIKAGIQKWKIRMHMRFAYCWCFFLYATQWVEIRYRISDNFNLTMALINGYKWGK